MQTRERWANEAMSAMAVRRRISVRISDGMWAIGQGGGGEPSVGGEAIGTDEVEKEAINWLVEVVKGPSRE